MQTQDLELREIHQENKEVKKKLEMFRSGLEKLMNKKSINKKHTQPVQRHQPPSHDSSQLQHHIILKPQQQHKPTPYKTSTYNIQSPSLSPQNQQFGFNSTLFRQISDETMMSNISSNSVQIKIGNEDYYQIGGMKGNNNNSRNQLQEVKNNSNTYFDNINNNNNSKPITIPTINFNNQHQLRHQPQQQPFKKSSLLFKQIDQLMNKVNKSTKLPIKPIQKYINKTEFQQQQKLISDRGDSLEIQLTLSSSRVKDNGEKSERNIGKRRLSEGRKQVNNNVIANKSASSSAMQKDSLLLKQANDFLKSMRQKSSSLTLQPGKPPLPPITPTPKPCDKVIQSDNKILQQPQSKIIKQPITTKIKQTLSQRKKLLIRQQVNHQNNIIIMDDTIEFQLSQQDEKQQQEHIKPEDRKQIVNNNINITSENQRQIQQLIQQRSKLLEQLQRIQVQLEKLQQQQ